LQQELTQIETHIALMQRLQEERLAVANLSDEKPRDADFTRRDSVANLSDEKPRDADVTRRDSVANLTEETSRDVGVTLNGAVATQNDVKPRDAVFDLQDGVTASPLNFFSRMTALNREHRNSDEEELSER
jgi:hypothetical protein